MSTSNSHPLNLDRLNQVLAGKIRACPLCNRPGTLSAMPTLMELREYHNGDFIVGGTPIIPLAVLTCSNCGNTILINALATGIMDVAKGPSGSGSEEKSQ